MIEEMEKSIKEQIGREIESYDVVTDIQEYLKLTSE